MMHCGIESTLSFLTLFWGKKFQFKIQIGITFECIDIFMQFLTLCFSQKLLLPEIFDYFFNIFSWSLNVFSSYTSGQNVKQVWHKQSLGDPLQR